MTTSTGPVHARTRVSLRDRFRRAPKPGTPLLAGDGQDVIGTAPETDEVAGASIWMRALNAPAGFGGASATGAMPAPAIRDADPDWDAILAQYETSRARRVTAARALEDTALTPGGPSLAEMTAMDTPPVMDRPYTAPPRPARGPSPIYDHLHATWDEIRRKPGTAVVLTADYDAWVRYVTAPLHPGGGSCR